MNKKITITIVVGIFLLFILALIINKYFLGVTVQIDGPTTVYFDTASSSWNHGNPIIENIEFNNDQVNHVNIYEFDNISFTLVGSSHAVKRWTAWVRDIFSYTNNWCLINHNVHLKSTCCGLNGYESNYGDRPRGSGSWEESCFVYDYYKPNLSSITIAGQNVQMTRVGDTWTTINFADIANNYCRVNYVDDICSIPVVITNKDTDGSRLDISISATWIPIDLCRGISCPSMCDGNVAKVNGTCSGGQCSYQETYCNFGCLNSICKPDPCIGVSCPNVCQSSNTLLSNGNCQAGQCVYTTLTCQNGCTGNNCIGTICTTGQERVCTLNSVIGKQICSNNAWGACIINVTIPPNNQTNNNTNTTCDNSTGNCNNPPTEKTNYLLYGLIAIGIVIFIITLYVIYVRWKKK